MTDNLQVQLEQLPTALAGHLAVTVVPLALGVVLSVPLGLLAVRRRRLREAILAVAGVVQTVPGLALLALMVPVLVAVGRLVAPLGVSVPALGPLPVGIALTLYAMLPVVRNTVAGVESVDRTLLEAARALGMTEAQIRWQIELPLAAPVLLAGIRTAAVWVVGMGTLATPVGAQSLGSYIFAGLQTRNPLAVAFGCVGAAALALGVDGAIGVVERSVRDRRPRRGIAALVALGGAVAGGLALPHLHAGGDLPVVVVGGKPFTEQYVLGALVEATLHDAGFRVQRRDGLGSTVALDGLAAGEIDVAVDYSGTLWAHHLRRSGTADGETVIREVCAALHERDRVACVGPLGFENAYALAVRADVARERGWQTIGDLAPAASALTIGADYEFFQRPEWAAVQAAYGLSFSRQATFDPSFLYEAAAGGEVDVVTAYTTDGRVSAFDLALLDDPRGALPPYDALLLLGPEAPAGVAEALAPLVGAIRVEAMREANRRVDVDGVTPAAAAAWLRGATGTARSPGGTRGGAPGP